MIGPKESRLSRSRQYQTIHPWLLRVNISHAARTLYISLLFFARGDDSAMPKVRTLAEEMECSQGSVREYLRELDREGLLERVPRYCERTNAQLANDYVLYTDTEMPSPKPDRAEIDEEQPVLPPIGNSDRGGIENSYRGPIRNPDTLNIDAVSSLRNQREESPPIPPSSPKKWWEKTPDEQREESDRDFELLKGSYPERGGAQSWPVAKRRLEECVRRGDGFANILAGAKRYRDAMEAAGKLGTKFVKTLANWLDCRGWEDEYLPEAPAASKGNEPESVADMVRRLG